MIEIYPAYFPVHNQPLAFNVVMVDFIAAGRGFGHSPRFAMQCDELAEKLFALPAGAVKLTSAVLPDTSIPPMKRSRATFAKRYPTAVEIAGAILPDRQIVLTRGVISNFG